LKNKYCYEIKTLKVIARIQPGGKLYRNNVNATSSVTTKTVEIIEVQ